MSFVNYNSKEINCKIVYFGPAGSGKTANLRYIYQQTAPENRGNLASLNAPSENTLLFDFLPLSVGTINDFKIRLHLYTVPGQAQYDASRKLLLRGVDGIVFVIDSDVTRLEANLESWLALKNNLEEQGYEIEKIPLIFQLNKRDVPNASPVDELARAINPTGRPQFEAIARTGVGVMETLKGLSSLVLKELQPN
jgi:signal recognition particle receptor subunit beta